MTSDEIDEEVLQYFSPEWTPPPGEGWFKAAQLAEQMSIPRNTAISKLARAVELGDFEMRKSGRESWYRKVEK